MKDTIVFGIFTFISVIVLFVLILKVAWSPIEWGDIMCNKYREKGRTWHLRSI